jgi:DNA-binding beta-propeller fold protein YncE
MTVRAKATGPAPRPICRSSALSHCLIGSLILGIGTKGFGADLPYVNFEGKQTTPARLSPDGARLFVVNTPDARLSVFDISRPSNPTLIAEVPVGIEPVSVNPRTSDEAWVVNELSDSVSIVSVTRAIVTDTLYTPDEPTDIVFALGKAFVTASRKNQILVYDATNHTQLATIPVFGENPRAFRQSHHADPARDRTATTAADKH